MLLQDFSPSPALRWYVKCFRILHFCFDPLQSIPYKAYPPKPEQTLHFFLKEPFCIKTKNQGTLHPPSILFKAQQTALINQLTQHDFIDVQIVFQPSAIFQLTGIPATVLTNQFLDATVIFPTTIQSTFSQLQEAKDYAELIRIAEVFTSSLVQKTKKKTVLLDAVCELMVKHQGNVSMDWLAEQACYSTKQFKRQFAERVGLNPKTYARILRLNRAYNFRNCFPKKNWNTIAAQCGYTDYQHLAKDYKEFNGVTPAELHNLENRSPESELGLSKGIYRSRFVASF
jgi:AraC-like DNA-binding protein